MKKLLPVLAAALCVSLLVAAPALAAGGDIFAPGDTGKISGKLDSSAFSAGQTVCDAREVKGLLFSAGYDTQVTGSGEYVLAAGYGTTLSGEAENDAFLAGYNVELSGKVGRDVFATGNRVVFSGETQRNIYVAASSVYISGTVGKDVYVSAETLTVSEDARITGTLHYGSSTKADIRADETVSTEIYDETTSAENAGSAKSEPGMASKIFSWVLGVAGLVGLAFLLLWLTDMWEALDKKYVGAPFGKYAAAFGIGCAVLAGVPLVALILIISRIGLRAAFIMLLLYAAVIIAAPIFVGFALGTLIWRSLLKKNACYWAELPIGILVYRLLVLVPYLGVLVGFAGLAYGLGAAALMLGKKKKARPVALTEEPEGTAE